MDAFSQISFHFLSQYLGESEKAVRQCFQRAKNSAPCVIFFDEFDALCPKRSSSTTVSYEFDVKFRFRMYIRGTIKHGTDKYFFLNVRVKHIVTVTKML